jgi:glycosyltransferase involved in cell wall biosynthesis
MTLVGGTADLRFLEWSMSTASLLSPSSLLESAYARVDGTRSRLARRRLQVVIVDEELPYPANSGKRIRTLNLILRLARRHQITYLCHRNADPVEANRAAAFLQAQGIQTIVVDRAVPPRTGLGFYARLAANLLSPLPYSVASHTSRTLQEAIRVHAAREAVDLWQCEWTPYAESLQVLKKGPRLVMAHNIESLIWQRYYQTETQPFKRWYIKRQWQKYCRFERRVLAEVEQTVAVSAADAALLNGAFAARRVSVVDNGVDTSWFLPGEHPGNPRRILFLGSLDWRPNLDAVAQLLERVFPVVRAAEPTAELWLVGRNPPEVLRRQVYALSGVTLYADVADVRPFLHGSGVLAVPLRIGGGSRLKILEALATGLPVVSTRIGAEGLSLEAGRHLTVVEGVKDMAAALEQCLRDPAAARDQAAAGRQRVLECYDWNSLADRLEQVWLSTVSSV